ncbi:MAG: DUF1465 family protein [Sphingopyxis sp.]
MPTVCRLWQSAMAPVAGLPAQYGHTHRILLNNMRSVTPLGASRSTIDGLYADALILADESRAWFERAQFERAPFERAQGHDRARYPAPATAAVLSTAPAAAPVDDDGEAIKNWAGRNDPVARVALSCESLRLTTRLMHIIAWLLMQRGIGAGEIAADAMALPTNRLGPSPDCDAAVRAMLPDRAQRLIDASLTLHHRVADLELRLLASHAARTAPDAAHPVHAMQGRLAATLGHGVGGTLRG